MGQLVEGLLAGVIGIGVRRHQVKEVRGVIGARDGGAGAELPFVATRVHLDRFRPGGLPVKDILAADIVGAGGEIQRVVVFGAGADIAGGASAGGEAAAGRGLARIAGRRGRQGDGETVADLVIAIGRKGAAQEQLQVRGRLPVEIHHRPGAFARQGIVADLLVAGDDAAIIDIVGDAAGTEILGLDGAGGIIARQHQAILIAGAELGAQRDVAFIGRLAGQVVMAKGKAAIGEGVLAVKGAQGRDVHRAGDGVGVQVGGQRLGHGQRTDQRGGNVVQLDLAAVRLGRCGRLAIDGDVGEGRRRAADDDIAAFALVVGHRHAHHAAHRFGDILVGQLADIVGIEGLDKVVGGLLPLQRHALGQALAADRDMLGIGDLDFHVGGRALGGADPLAAGGIADIVNRQLVVARCQTRNRKLPSAPLRTVMPVPSTWMRAPGSEALLPWSKI